MTLQAATDADLVAAVLKGDQPAFTKLMARHKGWLFGFIRRHVATSEDAYDILQETFASAWQALKRYDRTRPLDAWLRRIALNKCRDFGRRRAVRRTLSRLIALETRMSAVDEFDATDEEARTSARLIKLDQAIAGLPAFYKAPLLLAMVEGLSQDEVAKMLNTTRKAVEMRLRRARRRLAAEMGEEAEG